MYNLNYHGDKPHVYLKPGELYFSKKPTIITTVLGSCVSVTLFHQPSGLASICHILQPRCPRPDQCLTHCSGKYRFAICTIQEMSRKMISHNLRPRDIEVKLFGGAALIGSRHPEAITNSIGQLNVKAAMETLDNCGFTLKVMDVGGAFGRKIIFDSGTGEVLMKRLNRPNYTDAGA